ncbi:hypothetical protein [Rhodococcus phenolicus]|uniref:hypothetical protein n=1 Tax=Rhodococcus phenolicus TaxID=263849 RepID=UPI00082E3907|nr:hypothetical protein [Rhodococcus phenolicus]
MATRGVTISLWFGEIVGDCCSIDRDNDASLALIRKFSEFREDGDESDEKSLFFKHIRRSGATGRKVEALG